jgi:mRNA interferase RelE/StbE
VIWKIEYNRRAQKGLNKLPLVDHRRMVAALETMRQDPFVGDCRALQGHIVSYRRRVGDYRILFDLEWASKTIEVRDIGPRGSKTYKRR